MSNYQTDCREFTGYRPCRHHRSCDGCPHYERATPRVLLINLDALGDVLRTTALLPAIRRQHPAAHITWLTRSRAAVLLEGNPLIDEVLTLDLETEIILRSRHFDLLLCADKSQVAGALAMQIHAAERRGFGMESTGAILPLNIEASHLYAMGLNDTLKFHTNLRTEQDLLAEALGFVHQADGYTLALREDERSTGPRRRVGFNTGCSPAYPHKKLPQGVQASAIRALAEQLGEPVLLLGGPEDTERNAQLALELGPLVEASPTELGIRRGAAEIDRCDVVVTGDSLGMHLAIARGKHVVAWFGPTCPQEIDLYGRGVKLRANVECAPCWKTDCDRAIMCWDRVPVEAIVGAVHDCLLAREADQPIDAVRGGP